MSKWRATGKYLKINRVLDIITFILVVIYIAMVFIIWVNSPDIIPTHYGFNGKVDAYGSKNTLFIIMPILVILYIGLTALSKYPNIYNYAIEINENNRQKQYNMAATCIKVINLEIIAIFFYVEQTIVSGGIRISMTFLPLMLVLLFGTIGFYIYKSIKNK